MTVGHKTCNPSTSSFASSFTFIDDDEAEYMGLIQNRVRDFFPNFATAISNQSAVEREIGRCAVLDFEQGCQPRCTSFQNLVQLRHYLLDTSSALDLGSRNPGKRRLFILEDLPCNYVLALGSRLKIPPSFFAGQYDDPAVSTFNHRNPFARFTRSQFRLRYATSNRVEIDVPLKAECNTSTFAFNTNVSRYLNVYDPKGPCYDEPRSHHQISFWSSHPREDGSWDAVLLVDPPLQGFVRCLPSMQLAPLRFKLRDEDSMPKHFLYPETHVQGKLPHKLSEWSRCYATPEYRSLFDDTLDMMLSNDDDGGTGVTDPMSAVEIPRKLVIATLIAFLRRRQLNLFRLQKCQLQQNFLSSFSEGPLSKWHHQFFDFVVGSCAAMKAFCREIDDNMIALGLPTSSNMPLTANMGWRPPQWEIDGWRSVQDLTRVIDGLTNSLATGYLQYITIQEARISNGNAQSLSKITVLTMLFIPLSTVAAIFSMGGDFLPGSSRAWVFWVVAIPVVLILMFLYWRQQIVVLLQRSKRSLLPISEAQVSKL